MKSSERLPLSAGSKVTTTITQICCLQCLSMQACQWLCAALTAMVSRHMAFLLCRAKERPRLGETLCSNRLQSMHCRQHCVVRITMCPARIKACCLAAKL